MCIRFSLSLSEIFNGNCTNLAVALLPKQENGKLSGNAYKTSKITLYCLKDEEYCRDSGIPCHGDDTRGDESEPVDVEVDVDGVPPQVRHSVGRPRLIRRLVAA